MIDEAVGKLATIAGRAVDVLSAALDDDRATIRVRAATTLLDALLRVRAHAELDDRLTEIEQRIASSRDHTDEPEIPYRSVGRHRFPSPGSVSQGSP